MLSILNFWNSVHPIMIYIYFSVVILAGFSSSIYLGKKKQIGSLRLLISWTKSDKKIERVISYLVLSSLIMTTITGFAIFLFDF